MGARHKARKRALDVLFEADLRGSDPLVTLEETRQADLLLHVADASSPRTAWWLAVGGGLFAVLTVVIRHRGLHATPQPAPKEEIG